MWSSAKCALESQDLNQWPFTFTCAKQVSFCLSHCFEMQSTKCALKPHRKARASVIKKTLNSTKLQFPSYFPKENSKSRLTVHLNFFSPKLKSIQIQRHLTKHDREESNSPNRLPINKSIRDVLQTFPQSCLPALSLPTRAPNTILRYPTWSLRKCFPDLWTKLDFTR